MSEEKNRAKTEREIAAELETTRGRLADSVNQLVGSLDPKENLKLAGEDARARVSGFATDASVQVERALKGDKDALKRVVPIAAGAALVAGLLARRIFK